MDTKQPEALILAALNDAETWPGELSIVTFAARSAAELRRLQSENEQLRAGYDAARLEIESLQAQLDAVGAGGVGPLMAAAEQPAAPEDSAVFDFWRADHMPQSDKSEAWAEWCALRSTRLAPQQAAQAQEEAVAQAVAAEREACAQLAAQTVCDLHIPTGVKIYGSKAARAIRARDANAS